MGRRHAPIGNVPRRESPGGTVGLWAFVVLVAGMVALGFGMWLAILHRVAQTGLL
jgi:hypothetical protein